MKIAISLMNLLQMAKACWWFFFSKIIDLADTVLQSMCFIQ